MAILANRVKTKNNFVELSRFVFLGLKKVFIIGLIFACTYLLYFPADNFSKLTLEITGRILNISSVVTGSSIEGISTVSDKLFYFKNLEAENRLLKLKLSEFNKTTIQADNLQAENIELRKLLNVTQSVKYNFITSRLIGVNTTPLSSMAIIEAGSKDGVKIDDLITDQDNLIGRIVSVSNNYSSIMLLNDPNSRVPIITSTSKERGILTKQGDDMQIIYLPEEHSVKIGELIHTSGDGKIYPHGLLIGHVSKINTEGIFVKLKTNLNHTEFVKVESRPYES